MQFTYLFFVLWAWTMGCDFCNVKRLCQNSTEINSSSSSQSARQNIATHLVG